MSVSIPIARLILFFYIYLRAFCASQYVCAGNCTNTLQSGNCTDTVCNNGQCYQANSTHYRCLCRRGFTAVHCNQVIDECSLNLCKNDANCLNVESTGFRCHCPPLYSGVYCETLTNICQQEHCLNDATCEADHRLGFRCNCPVGFSGTRCEVDVNECQTLNIPCANNGTCRNTLGGYECDCAAPFAGNRCEITFCSSQTANPCQNGKCIIDSRSPGGFHCNCSVGFAGVFCDENIDECIDMLCNGRGMCVDDIGAYRCLCLPGWTGTDCESRVDQCTNNQCKNGAGCLISNASSGYYCQCQLGFEGTFCQTAVDHCRLSPCDRGSCVNFESGYQCACELGWTGSNCSEKDCSGISCYNGGNCVIRDSGPQCQCPPDWLGGTCSEPVNLCQTAPCKNGGLCQLTKYSEAKFECLCEPDFGGYYCEHQLNDCLPGRNCLNGGTCFDGIANFTCTCPQQFTGWKCEIPRVIFQITTADTSPTTTKRMSVFASISTLATTTTTNPTTITVSTTLISPTSVIPRNSSPLPPPVTSVLVQTSAIFRSSSRYDYNASSRLFLQNDVRIPVNSTLAVVSAFVDNSAVWSSISFSPSTAEPAHSLLLTSDLPSVGSFEILGGGNRSMFNLGQSQIPAMVSRYVQQTSSTYDYEAQESQRHGTTTLFADGLLSSVPLEMRSSYVYSPITSTVLPVFINPGPTVHASYNIVLPTQAYATNATQFLTTTATVMTTVATVNRGPNNSEPINVFIESSTTESPTAIPVATTVALTAVPVMTTTVPLSTTAAVTIPSFSTTTTNAGVVTPNPEPLFPSCPFELCKNGGTCIITAPSDQFRCECPLKFMGDLCEEEIWITRPMFDGRGWLRYPGFTLRSTDVLEVALRFLPEVVVQEADSTIFYGASSGKLDSYTRLDMNSTALIYTASCGLSKPIRLVVPKPTMPSVLPGFFTVVLKLQFPTDSSSSCSATIQSESSGSSTMASGYSVDNITRSDVFLDFLFVGGYPGVPTGFAGQISNFAVNRRERNFDTDPLMGVNVLQADLAICAPDFCRNNGTCLEAISGWTCACPTGFEGTVCEVASCESNPCFGGSTCLSMDNDQVRCVCPLGRYGMYCESTYEHQNQLKFFGATSGYTSYIVFAPIKNAAHHLEIILDISFSSLSTTAAELDGSLLLLIGSPELIFRGYDFLMLGMKDNFPVLIYNLGGGPLVVNSPSPLDLNVSTHSIHLFFDSDLGAFIQVDDIPPSLIAIPPTYVFNAFDGTLQVFFGGYDVMDVLPLLGFHGFNGFLNDLQFRTHRIGTFTRFSQLLAGRNVLPANSDNIDACGNSPCGNSTCISFGASFSCGCQAKMNENCPLSTSDICRPTRNKCSANARCVPDLFAARQYRCDCPIGKTGEFCQKDTRISDAFFNGINSYISYPPSLKLREKLLIRMEILPTAPSGLLFYVAEFPNSAHSGDFVSLFLFNRTIYFRFNLGNSLPKSISSNITLPGYNDTWLIVEAGRDNQSAWLSVNGSTISTRYATSLKYLDVFTDIYVGGISQWNMIAPAAVLGDHVSFGGCIREFQINQHKYELNYNGATGGMNIADCDGTACGYNECENAGQCVVRTQDPAGLDCVCAPSYYGSNCQLSSDCKNNRCEGGSVCKAEFASRTKYVCNCPVGRTGEFCENDTSLNTSAYFNNSYLAVKFPGYETSNKSHNFIRFRFRTSLPDTLLLWTGKVLTRHYDYLGIGLRNGFVQIVWNLGWTSKRTVISRYPYRFDDGNWHQLVLLRDGRNLSASISTRNDSSPVFLSGFTSGNYIDLETDGVYYLGGFPEMQIQEKTLDYFANSFMGCISELQLTQNGTPIEFIDALDGRNILPCDGIR